MTTTRITENHYRRRAACNTDTARKVDYSRSAPSRIGAVCRSQQGGQKLADTVLCLQISQGKSVWGREIEPRTVLYFSLEDTLGRLQERLYQLVDAEEDPERLILQTEVTELGRDWKNKSSVSSILTPILASSSSIPCKRCEKPSEMVVCMPMITGILVR